MLLSEGDGVKQKQWSQPLDKLSRTVDVTEEGIRVTESYRVHRCAERLAAESEALQSAIASKTGEQRDWAIANSPARTKAEALLIAEDAMTRKCPSCNAEIGERCMNLTARRVGREIQTVWPHQKRMEK